MNNSSLQNQINPQPTLDLEPIRSRGPAALDTTGCPRILKAILRELQVVWENTMRESITLSSLNLFASTQGSPGGNQRIPSTGNLTVAKFDLYLEGHDRPHWFTVRPPHTVQAQFQEDLPTINHLLQKAGIRVATTIAIILLGLATALAPALGDGDGDDDDCSSDRHSCCLCP